MLGVLLESADGLHNVRILLNWILTLSILVLKCPNQTEIYGI